MTLFLSITFFILFWLLSFFFSGMETGFISYDRLKLERESKNDPTKKKLLNFTDKPDRFLGVTLIGNNIALVVVAIIFSVSISDYLRIENKQLSTIVLSLFMLISAEIIPKSLFRENSVKLVSTFFPLIQFFYHLLRPIIGIVKIIDYLAFKIFKLEKKNRYQYLTREDLTLMLADKDVKKHFNQPQKDMLEEALEFNSLTAKNVMIPRTDIVAVHKDMAIEALIELAKDEGYTRFPVYNDNLDNIIGVLIIYDVIKKEDYKDLKAVDLAREALFVPETMDVSTLLTEMQSKRRSMAIVVDNFGGTSGLVTIEDILEEIVGEIEDEYDNDQPEEEDVKVIDQNTLIVRGTVEVDELNDEHHTGFSVGDYETIAGLVINKLARIPLKGQTIGIEGWRFEILQATQTRIDLMKLTRIKNESS